MEAPAYLVSCKSLFSHMPGHNGIASCLKMGGLQGGLWGHLQFHIFGNFTVNQIIKGPIIPAYRLYMTLRIERSNSLKIHSSCLLNFLLGN